MSTEIFEISEDEIELVAGGAKIDPPTQSSSHSTEGLDVPQIDNNPPG